LRDGRKVDSNRPRGAGGARAALSAGAAHAVYRVPHGGLPDLLLLLPAAAVYVAVDAVLAGEGRRRVGATSGRGFPGRLRLVLARLFGWPAAACALPALYLLQRAYHLHVARVARRHNRTADLHWHMVEALALAIEAKDGSTHGHQRRVQIYAGEIGRRLNLSKTR